MYFKIALDILGLLHINFSIGLWIFIKKNLWDFDWDYIKATDQFGEDPKFYSFLFKLVLLSLGKGGKMRASLWYHLGNLFKIYVSYPPLLNYQVRDGAWACLLWNSSPRNYVLLSSPLFSTTLFENHCHRLHSPWLAAVIHWG